MEGVAALHVALRAANVLYVPVEQRLWYLLGPLTSAVQSITQLSPAPPSEQHALTTQQQALPACGASKQWQPCPVATPSPSGSSQISLLPGGRRPTSLQGACNAPSCSFSTSTASSPRPWSTPSSAPSTSPSAGRSSSPKPTPAQQRAQDACRRVDHNVQSLTQYASSLCKESWLDPSTVMTDNDRHMALQLLHAFKKQRLILQSNCVDPAVARVTRNSAQAEERSQAGAPTLAPAPVSSHPLVPRSSPVASGPFRGPGEGCSPSGSPMSELCSTPIPVDLPKLATAMSWVGALRRIQGAGGMATRLQEELVWIVAYAVPPHMTPQWEAAQPRTTLPTMLSGLQDWCARRFQPPRFSYMAPVLSPWVQQAVQAQQAAGASPYISLQLARLLYTATSTVPPEVIVTISAIMQPWMEAMLGGRSLHLSRLQLPPNYSKTKLDIPSSLYSNDSAPAATRPQQCAFADDDDLDATQPSLTLPSRKALPTGSELQARNPELYEAEEIISCFFFLFRALEQPEEWQPLLPSMRLLANDLSHHMQGQQLTAMLSSTRKLRPIPLSLLRHLLQLGLSHPHACTPMVMSLLSRSMLPLLSSTTTKPTYWQHIARAWVNQVGKEEGTARPDTLLGRAVGDPRSWTVAVQRLHGDSGTPWTLQHRQQGQAQAQPRQQGSTPGVDSAGSSPAAERLAASLMMRTLGAYREPHHQVPTVLQTTAHTVAVAAGGWGGSRGCYSPQVATAVAGALDVAEVMALNINWEGRAQLIHSCSLLLNPPWVYTQSLDAAPRTSLLPLYALVTGEASPPPQAGGQGAQGSSGSGARSQQGSSPQFGSRQGLDAKHLQGGIGGGVQGAEAAYQEPVRVPSILGFDSRSTEGAYKLALLWQGLTQGQFAEVRHMMQKEEGSVAAAGALESTGAMLASLMHAGSLAAFMQLAKAAAEAASQAFRRPDAEVIERPTYTPAPNYLLAKPAPTFAALSNHYQAMSLLTWLLRNSLVPTGGDQQAQHGVVHEVIEQCAQRMCGGLANALRSPVHAESTEAKAAEPAAPGDGAASPVTPPGRKSSQEVVWPEPPEAHKPRLVAAVLHSTALLHAAQGGGVEFRLQYPAAARLASLAADVLAHQLKQPLIVVQNNSNNSMLPAGSLWDAVHAAVALGLQDHPLMDAASEVLLQHKSYPRLLALHDWSPGLLPPQVVRLAHVLHRAGRASPELPGVLAYGLCSWLESHARGTPTQHSHPDLGLRGLMDGKGGQGGGPGTLLSSDTAGAQSGTGTGGAHAWPAHMLLEWLQLLQPPGALNGLGSSMEGSKAATTPTTAASFGTSTPGAGRARAADGPLPKFSSTFLRSALEGVDAEDVRMLADAFAPALVQAPPKTLLHLLQTLAPTHSEQLRHNLEDRLQPLYGAVATALLPEVPNLTISQLALLVHCIHNAPMRGTKGVGAPAGRNAHSNSHNDDDSEDQGMAGRPLPLLFEAAAEQLPLRLTELYTLPVDRVSEALGYLSEAGLCDGRVLGAVADAVAYQLRDVESGVLVHMALTVTRAQAAAQQACSSGWGGDVGASSYSVKGFFDDMVSALVANLGSLNTGELVSLVPATASMPSTQRGLLLKRLASQLTNKLGDLDGEQVVTVLEQYVRARQWERSFYMAVGAHMAAQPGKFQAEHVVRAMQALCAAGVKSHAVYDNLIASLKDIQRLQAARKHQEAANAKDASGSSMAEVIHKEAAKRGASGMRVLGLSILSLWQLQSVYNVLKALDHAGAEDFGQEFLRRLASEPHGSSAKSK